MADYSAIAAKAARKIAEKGMPIVFVAQDEGAYDPATNTRPTIETRTPVMGVRTAPTVDEVQSGQFAVGGHNNPCGGKCSRQGRRHHGSARVRGAPLEHHGHQDCGPCGRNFALQISG